MHKYPLIQPIQSIPIDDNENNFLNFEERQSVQRALYKLSVQNFGSLLYFYEVSIINKEYENSYLIINN